jgi:N-acetylglucosamine kinase-like BadF-type ATPase
VTPPLILAVDGGNSKTDLALARADGQVLALVRGPQSSPHHLGVDGSLSVLERLLADALAEAGLRNGHGPVADIGQLLISGVDFPAEEEELRVAANGRRLASAITVANDTFAVLRAGTDRGWGVAVVCGAGINCVGVAPDGRHARFPALGAITGDWGGGYDVGLAAVSAGARSDDGRGPVTTLARAVPAYFGLTTTMQLAEAIHRGHIPLRRVTELSPVIFAEAERDPVAASIMGRLADEVVILVRTALARLGLANDPVDVVLGGGLMEAGNQRLIGAIEAGLAEAAPGATVRTTSSPPIVGAALLGLDALGVGAEARERLRLELEGASRRVRHARVEART